MVFANVDYEFAVGSGDEKRNGVRGAFEPPIYVVKRTRSAISRRPPR